MRGCNAGLARVQQQRMQTMSEHELSPHLSPTHAGCFVSLTAPLSCSPGLRAVYALALLALRPSRFFACMSLALRFSTYDTKKRAGNRATCMIVQRLCVVEVNLPPQHRRHSVAAHTALFPLEPRPLPCPPAPLALRLHLGVALFAACMPCELSTGASRSQGGARASKGGACVCV